MTRWQDWLIVYIRQHGRPHPILPRIWISLGTLVFAVERYNPVSDKWEICPSMAIKRGSLGGATVREKIYALGGGNGSKSFDDTECFDSVVGTWTPSTKMLERVTFLTYTRVVIVYDISY